MSGEVVVNEHRVLNSKGGITKIRFVKLRSQDEQTKQQERLILT